MFSYAFLTLINNEEIIPVDKKQENVNSKYKQFNFAALQSHKNTNQINIENIY